VSGVNSLAFDINNAGQIVGYYSDNSTVHGLLATPAQHDGAAHTLDTSNQVAQLVQAMAGFGAISGNGDSFNTVALDNTSQQFLTTPHQHA
jgi:hypothetical protein